MTTGENLVGVNTILQSVCDTAQGIIDALQQNERIPMKQLVAAVSKKSGYGQLQVAPIVKMFVKNYHRCYVRAGRSGGVFRKVRIEEATCKCCRCGYLHKPAK